MCVRQGIGVRVVTADVGFGEWELLGWVRVCFGCVSFPETVTGTV